MPMIIGIATMMGQILLDAWFLGQVGDRALAAQGFGFPVLLIITSVAIGLGAGTSSVVARAYGADDDRLTRRIATDSLLLSFAATAVVAIAGIVTIDPLFTALGAPVDMLPMIRPFMTIMYLAVPFIVLGMVAMASIRATGNSKLPGKIMVAGAVCNVALSPLLIFGLGPLQGMGLNGAALAAFVCRGGVFFAAAWFMLNRMDLISLNKPNWPELSKSCRAILHVGIPAAGTNIIVPIGATLVTAMMARYGPDAVAGFGVASRIESMCLVVFYAMSSIIGPFVGQNFSAGLESRIHEALKLSALACLAIGVTVSLLLSMGSAFVPGLFSDSPTVQAVIAQYLWIVPISYGTYGIVMIVNAAFNGIGRPMPGVFVSGGRILVLYLPFAWLGSELFGIIGIFAAYSAANLISGALGFAWASRIVREECAV